MREMIENNIKVIDPVILLKAVHILYGKVIRAELFISL
jgi:hypothetical protein